MMFLYGFVKKKSRNALILPVKIKMKIYEK